MPNRPRSHSVSGTKRHTMRPPAVQRGYTWTWHKASEAFLKAHPLCWYCELLGRVTAAEHTDHYNPPSGPDDPLFWNEENWRASCSFHNSGKRDMMGDEYVRKLLQ